MQLRALSTLLLALPLLACSSEEDPSTTTGPAGPVAEGASTGRARSSDPRVVALRMALEQGHLDEARLLAKQLGEAAGIEGLLLRARTAALGADDIAASHLIEEARALDAADPRVYGTSAEIHAAAGRLDTADQEIREGLRICGAGPELLRARGVHMICQQGGAEGGLSVLAMAREQDPELPFLGRPLGQAHLLRAKERQREGDGVSALRHVEASLANDPDDVDARRLYAECLLGMLDFGRALAVYEALIADGEPLEGEVAGHYKNAGIAALQQGRRDVALRHFLRARQHGLSAAELRTGAHLLEAESRKFVEAGRELWEAGDREAARAEIKHAFVYTPGYGLALAEYAYYDALEAREQDDAEGAETHAQEALGFHPSHAGARDLLASARVVRALAAMEARDWPTAQAAFEEALVYDEESLEAQRFLGTAHFQQGAYEDAAILWSRILRTAEEEGVELPDPLHIELASAWFLGGFDARAKECLEAYLERAPDGAWAEKTRATLEALVASPGFGDE